jgi:hypothetical protein
MKKTFIILLIVVALPLYIWDTNLFLSNYFGKRKQSQQIIDAKIDLLPHFAKATFVQKGRSPFVPYKELPKPAIKTQVIAKKTSSAQAIVNPPPISINGIMWNPSNPVAIINFNDGSSIVAKKGQMLKGNILVKNIDKNQVEVEYTGKSFLIKK